MSTRLTLSGMLAAGVLGMGLWGCAHGEKNEVKMALGELPPAVRATLQQQAQGGTIGEVEKETKNGKTVYEADVDAKGQKWEIKIAEDGTFLGRTIDTEDEKD